MLPSSLIYLFHLFTSLPRLSMKPDLFIYLIYSLRYSRGPMKRTPGPAAARRWVVLSLHLDGFRDSPEGFDGSLGGNQTLCRPCVRPVLSQHYHFVRVDMTVNLHAACKFFLLWNIFRKCYFRQTARSKHYLPSATILYNMIHYWLFIAYFIILTLSMILVTTELLWP